VENCRVSKVGTRGEATGFNLREITEIEEKKTLWEKKKIGQSADL